MPRQSQRDYPRLFHLLGSYFSQEWPFESDSWEGVIAEYKQDEPRKYHLAAAEEIDELLKFKMPADELGKFAHDELCCDFLPRPDLGGPDFRQWLTQVASLLRA